MLDSGPTANMKRNLSMRLTALLAAITFTICLAQAQQGWGGYSQTGHWTTTNKDGSTTDHDTGKNDNGDTITTETTRDGDGRATFERTEVKGKDGKTKYIRMTKWGNRDKPWEITWGILIDYQDDHPDYKYDPKTGEWMREDKKLLMPSKDEINLKTEAAAIQMNSGGAITVESKTQYGSIRAYLPNDIVGGDTISGRVFVEPTGKNDAERTKNAGILEGYVIEVDKQKTKVSDGRGTWMVPVGLTALAVVLTDQRGRRVGGQNVTLHQPKVPWTSGFQAPTSVQAGRPIQVSGPFDGNCANTNVKFGGKDVMVLSESPRSATILSPRGVTGKGDLTISDNGKSVSLPCRVVGISLSIDKPELRRGENAKIQVVVSGLEGIDRPVSIHVTTLSSGAARMVGGNEQILVIHPNEVGTGSECQRSMSLAGAQAGRFTIETNLEEDKIDSVDFYNAAIYIRTADRLRHAATVAKAKDPNSKEAKEAEKHADNAETQAAGSMTGFTLEQRAAAYRKAAQEHRDRAKQLRSVEPKNDADRDARDAEAKAESEMAKEDDNKADAISK